jgi:hypothetical protein
MQLLWLKFIKNVDANMWPLLGVSDDISKVNIQNV